MVENIAFQALPQKSLYINFKINNSSKYYKLAAGSSTSVSKFSTGTISNGCINIIGINSDEEFTFTIPNKMIMKSENFEITSPSDDLLFKASVNECTQSVQFHNLNTHTV